MSIFQQDIFSGLGQDGSATDDAAFRSLIDELAQPAPPRSNQNAARTVPPDTTIQTPVATTVQAAAPRWLPYALIGGGVLVAGAILFNATRPVRANRRKRRRRR